MADGNFGERDIDIDLTATGARVIRDFAKGEFVKIVGITINGTAGATAGPIVLRKEAANGPIVYSCDGKATQTYVVNDQLYTSIHRGLYMDTQTNAWAAGSHMIIHTA